MTTPTTETDVRQALRDYAHKPGRYTPTDLVELRKVCVELHYEKVVEIIDRLLFYLEEDAREQRDPTYVRGEYRTPEEIEIDEDLANHYDVGRP